MGVRINYLSTDEERNVFFKEKSEELARANNILIHYLSRDEHNDLYYQLGRPSANGIFIKNGEIYLNARDATKMLIEHELVFHELLHILSVPPEYRAMMNHDTEKSYKMIKREKSYKDPNRISCESAVIGAQSLIYEMIDGIGWLGGAFFRGHIRAIDSNGKQSTCVPQEWGARGQRLINRINLDFS